MVLKRFVVIPWDSKSFLLVTANPLGLGTLRRHLARHTGIKESAWLGSGYYYAYSYVVIFANILALITGISTLICMTNG